MKAVVYREYAPDDDYANILKVEDIDEPKPKADEVIFTNKIIQINDLPTTSDGEIAIDNDIAIPPWIKNNAGWWADGMIPDDAFVSGLQWLISNGIMKIS